MVSAKLSTIPEEDEDYILADVMSAYGICQDCRYELVTARFLHLNGTDYFLCNSCFYAADHEDDYGQDFEEVSYLQQEDDGFIDPGDQDDDFAVTAEEIEEAYVGSEDWWGDEIEEMKMNGSYELLTSG